MNPRLLTLAALVLSAAPAAAQSPAEQLDRRNRDQPEVVVEAGGRTGTCDVLTFDRDGKFLFAAGDDKVVRAWPYTAKDGLESDPAKVKTLRWRAWREQRGGIKSIALSPDGKRVVVGGYGLKLSSVVVLDRDTGDVLAMTWPKAVAEFNAVTAVAFDATDTRVGFGTADGSVWVWTPKKLDKPDDDGRPATLPLWVGRHDRIPRPNGNGVEPFNQPRLLYFADDGTLVSVAQSGQVLACDLAGDLKDEPHARPAAKQLFHVDPTYRNGGRVYRAERTPDGKALVVARAGPEVSVWTMAGEEAAKLTLPTGTFPRSIAVASDGRLAVGVATELGGDKDAARFYSEGNDAVWFYPTPTKGGEPAKKLPLRGPAEALAFHPTGNRLAVAGGDADEVTLLDLATDKPVSVAKGAGRRPWGVNISENGLVFGVQTGRDATSTSPNARGAGEWTRFEVPRIRPTPDESQKWVGPRETADGWTVVPDKDDRFVWHAVRPGVDLKLGLNRAADQAPTCYTFLPAANGKPTRVIVGHYYGCSLFELTPDRAGGGVLRAVRVFTGHGGPVLSVVAARKQDWFITGGADHTVAAWSLADWPSEPSLGAAFEVKGGKLTTTAVDAGSPAWEAGLRVGDVIDLLAVGNKPGVPQYDRRPAADRLPRERGWGNVGTAEEAAALLKTARTQVEYFFSVAPRDNGPRRTSLTTVRQRPIWKWFPAFNDRERMTDWTMWMWQGSFYHTSTHGDRLAGWHVNAPDVGGRPQFYQLQQFEKHFHRVDVMEKLVNTGSVSEALIEARGENPLPESFTDREPAPVRLGLNKSVLDAGGLPLTVTVRPRGTDVDLLPERVELWVNDHRFKVWPANGRKPLDEKLMLPANLFRNGENRLSVLTFNPAGGRAEDTRLIDNPLSAGRSDLLGLTVGVNDYADHRLASVGLARKGFDNLDSARNDATKLRESLLRFPGRDRFFRDGKIDLRLDADAGRDKLLKSLDDIAAAAKPEDVLVVFLAGHGDLFLPGGFGGVAVNSGRGVAGGGGVFLFCCPNYSPKKPADTAISADELFDALAKVNCRKVVLLDACHSGQAVEANVIRRFVPDGQGPFVMAACEQGELSYEDPKLGHGLFTRAVLDALGDDFTRADADRDGSLSPEELFGFVSRRVPALLKEIGKPADTQNPICFPRTPPRFVVVKR